MLFFFHALSELRSPFQRHQAMLPDVFSLKYVMKSIKCRIESYLFVIWILFNSSVERKARTTKKRTNRKVKTFDVVKSSL